MCSTPPPRDYPHPAPTAARRRRVSRAGLFTLLLGLAGLAAGSAAAAAGAGTDRPATAPGCPAPAIDIRPVAPGVWWMPGSAGDSNAANRGVISNLLAVRDGRRLWLLGSGPSVRHTRALACQLRRLSGRAVSDVIAPWARPELVLGQAGLPLAVRRWAHAEVAQAMRERCPHCIERLRQRLGEAAGDLEEGRVQLPDHLLQGASGRLGPWHWWRLERSPGSTVTLWVLPQAGIATAHGLLWADGAPDLRDSEVAAVARAARALAALSASPGGAITSALAGPARPVAATRLRWLPEQGPWLPATAPVDLQHYLDSLQHAVQTAQARGATETEVAGSLPGVADPVTLSERHALNWQRAWREAEALSFETPAR